MTIENGDDNVFTIMPMDTSIHDRATFCSGVDRIDNFLKRTAKKHQKGGFTRVWVATRPGVSTVIGYYAINAHTIEAGELTEVVGRYSPGHGQIPAAYLSMFGVDKTVQRQGLGRVLLVDAFKKLDAVSRVLGIKVIVLDILDDGDAEAFDRRARFYKGMGFQPFTSRPSRLYLPMETVRQLFTTHI